MKRIIVLLLISFSTIFVKADEGMWLMMFLNKNYTEMQRLGLHLTPDQIYSINNSSLKDAIVSFNGYCTGEIVSDKGLVFTNHHCGYESITKLSTPEHDYLTNGYWAKSFQEELKPDELFVRFFVRMGDVTNEIQAKLKPEMTEKQRLDVLKAEYDRIKKENEEGGKYKVDVRSFYNENEFYYFVYQEYDDVRFVGAPPSSIGKYGGDTDNWEWPRHTGDFSVFRVYADKDGNPASYSEQNVPLKPKHSLPINIKGVKPNDFAMILGFPGRTNRYMTSYGISQLIKYEYPAFIESSKTAMDVIKKYSDQSDKTRLLYADNYAGIANYWKNRIGMIESITKNKTIKKKAKLEKAFTKWLKKDKTRWENNSNTLSDIEKYYATTNDIIVERTYLRGLLRNSLYASLPEQFGNMLKTFAMQDAMNREKMLPRLKEVIDGDTYKYFDENVETDMLKNLFSLYLSKAPKALIPTSLQSYNPSASEQWIENSVFRNKESIEKFLANPNTEVIDNDPLYKLSKNLIAQFRNKSESEMQLEDAKNKGMRNFVGSLQKMSTKPMYADANSTIRLTYGTVQTLPKNSKRPNDAKSNYYTTLQGAIAKYKKGDEEFDLPQKLIDLYNAKNYGQYADKEGFMPVCFLSTNDITGGNSGSPVINGNGELIGIAFDGNWEAMSGDIVFESKLQRTINVDIRYVLFIIDKFAGATRLIDEMKIIK